MLNSPLDSKAIVTAVAQALPSGISNASLHEPSLGEVESRYLTECIDSGLVSSIGPFVDRFEQMLTDTLDVRHAVAVVNGTAALHVAMIVAGIGIGDEVLMPSLTFVATANAVAYTGAVPHFVDVDDSSLGINPHLLERYLDSIAVKQDGQLVNRSTGRRLRAIVPVHVFGHPVDMDALLDVSKDFGLDVIEDAAEALGSLYKNQPVGRHGRMATLSFNGNKIVTTGGGGAVLTNDETIYNQLRHLTTTAKVAHQWAFEHDQIGFNYRMPNINAALGCAQIERLDEFVGRKRLLAQRYSQSFAEVPGVRVFSEQPYAQSNYWLNALVLEVHDVDQRDRLLNDLNNAGFGCRPCWTPMHRLPMYKQNPRMDLTVTENLATCAINLPSSPFLMPVGSSPVGTLPL